MMNPKHKGVIQYLFLLVTMAVVLFYFQNRAIDVEQHNHRIDRLLHVNQTEAELDRLVLQLTFFKVNQYDPFVSTIHRLEQVLGEIEQELDEKRRQGHASYSKHFRQYRQALKQKLHLLERIKSKTALVINGLRYLPLAVDDLKSMEHSFRDEVRSVLEQLLHFNLFPLKRDLEKLNRQIGEMEKSAQLVGETKEAFANVLLHLRANLRMMNELGLLRDAYTSVPSSQYFDGLYHAYSDTFVESTKRFEYYSLLLLALTALLFLGLGFSLRQNALSRAAAERSWKQLLDAVENLSEAFVLFGADGRLVLHNSRYLEFYPWLEGPLKGGATLKDVQKINVSSGHVMLQGRDSDDDVVQSHSLRPGEVDNYVEQLSDGRWFLAGDSCNAAGETACVRVDITESKRVEMEMRKLYRALEQSPASVVITDTSGIIEYVNPKFEETTGYSAEEAIGNNPRMLKSGDKSLEEYRALWDAITSGKVWRGQFQNRRKDGRIYWESASISPVRGPDGTITHFIAVKEDITAQKRVEDQLRMNATVFDTTNEGIMVTDADNRIISVNPSFTQITGYQPEDVIGRSPTILSSGRHDSDYYQQMWHDLYENGYWNGEVWNRRKDGTVYPEWLSLVLIRNEEGEVTEHIGVFSDITLRKESEEQIRQQANFDALTGLPNRSLLMDRLERALISARRENWLVALLFVDLDRFKVVNDTMGHVVGDELLQQVSDRLEAGLREADTVARFGGDEFVIILEDIKHADDSAEVAGKLIEQLSLPFMLEDKETFVGASIGITLYPTDAEDVDSLLRNADMAMYRAKEAGRNNYQFFTLALNEQVHQRMELERDLRFALELNELHLCYQPIVNVGEGKVAFAEALLRWTHPVQGNIPPERFIPLAEDSALIGDIGLWVLRTACIQVAEWKRQGLLDGVSVNVSSRQVELGLGAEDVQEILEETGLPPQALKLEITESMVLENASSTLEWINQVRELGVAVTIDDFGVGYSSLSYLKQFRMDALKIDRSFVSDLSESQGGRSLVRAIVAMADSMGMDVIAEGVETQEQLAVLQDLSCDLMQGFLFGKPADSEQLPKVIEELAATVKSQRQMH